MKRSFVGKSSNAIFDAELLEKFRRDESSLYGLVGSDLLGKPPINEVTGQLILARGNLGFPDNRASWDYFRGVSRHTTES